MITDLIENTSENTSYLENTPQYISRIPQYIRQYPKLMTLMSLLLEYFDNTAHQIDGLGIQNRFLNDLDVNVLEQLANHYNLSIAKSKSRDLANYKDLLVGAISGVWATISSSGDRKSLLNILTVLYPTAEIALTESKMQYSVKIDTVDVVQQVRSILAYWLKTDVTGVQEYFEFNNKDSFTWKEYDSATGTEYIPAYVDDGITFQEHNTAYNWLGLDSNNEEKKEITYTDITDTESGVTITKADCGIYKQEYI